MSQDQQMIAKDVSHPSEAAFRGDINGLRAVAVLAVLAFHANITAVAGGYVGVDVFFVISGYLISRMIFRQVEAGRFRLATFYMRRIQRIVPALFVMILLVMATSVLLLYPTEIIDFAKSAVAAILSVSNILFWFSTGYFDAPSTAKPLLHTWSLGVEEQFYLVFPVLVLAMRRLGHGGRTAVLSVILVLSLGASVFLTATDASAAFYFPHSRIWEFVVGALLSYDAVPVPAYRWVREAVAAAGLAAILLAVFTFNSLTPFPGFAALLPCLGTAAVIYAGSAGPTLAGRLLCLRPVAFVGTISYSLYLYHWPFIVFQRLDGVINLAPSTTLNRIVLVIMMFVVSFLSWKYVETPFRAHRSRSRLAATSLILTPATVIVAAGLVVVLTGGLPGRFSAEAIRLASFLKYDPDQEMRTGSCFLDNSLSFDKFDKASCLHRTGDGPALLLFGDSHAGHLYPGFMQVYGNRASILEAAATGCKPLLRDIDDSTTCGRMIGYVFKSYLPTHHVDLLVVSARWAPEDMPFIGPTLDWLQRSGIRTVLVGPTPEYDVQLPGLLARSGTNMRSEIASHLEPEFGKLDREMEDIAKNRSEVTYFSPYQSLCDMQSCKFLAYGDPLIYDKGHLTRSGSRLLVGYMDKVLSVL